MCRMNSECVMCFLLYAHSLVILLLYHQALLSNHLICIHFWCIETHHFFQLLLLACILSYYCMTTRRRIAHTYIFLLLVSGILYVFFSFLFIKRIATISINCSQIQKILYSQQERTCVWLCYSLLLFSTFISLFLSAVYAKN